MHQTLAYFWNVSILDNILKAYRLARAIDASCLCTACLCKTSLFQADTVVLSCLQACQPMRTVQLGSQLSRRRRGRGRRCSRSHGHRHLLHRRLTQHRYMHHKLPLPLAGSLRQHQSSAASSGRQPQAGSRQAYRIAQLHQQLAPCNLPMPAVRATLHLCIGLGLYQ